MSSMNSIKMMIFLWQLEIVDSLTLLQFCRNCGAQSTRLTLVFSESLTNLNIHESNWLTI